MSESDWRWDRVQDVLCDVLKGVCITDQGGIAWAEPVCGSGDEVLGDVFGYDIITIMESGGGT